MNVSLYIARRYFYSKSKNKAINVITLIAVVGIVLGSAALFIVLSGFSGLRDFTVKFSSVVDPDLKAVAATGKTFVVTKEMCTKLDRLDEVAVYSKVVEEQVFVAFKNKHVLATLKGVDGSFRRMVEVDSILDRGKWLEQNSEQVVVGLGVSESLSLGTFNYLYPVNIYVPRLDKTPVLSAKNAFRRLAAVSVGIFNINKSLNDSGIYAPLGVVQSLLGYAPDSVSALAIKIKKNASETHARQKIRAILGGAVLLKNKRQLNDGLYKMLNTENIAVYLIFTLVLVVVFFNVVGCLIMMILDKKESLNMLFGMGVGVGGIRRIFFYQGSLMSVVGGLMGLAAALVMVWLQEVFAWVMITPSLPYPVRITAENVAIVCSTIALLGVVASKVASMRITRALVGER